ncbi:type II and III secretion system protein family protein [Stratiformator vulcanicus]|uniref:Type II secretion system protein D n=1 Tax=Stratiformator vulcanicus TaxID=2527980 RepID=A0A517R4X9_9PLAN|nr:pilus assembly protein N-terminal domain-containing protein [Stratiformator vulcanicus]QDT38946.1 Putative type II secretion system protein D precursor [Stratiformator vulcanicus]
MIKSNVDDHSSDLQRMDGQEQARMSDPMKQNTPMKTSVKRSRLALTTMCMLTCSVTAGSSALAQYVPFDAEPSDGPVIRQVAVSKRDRPLPPQISEMPDIMEELEVIDQRSQLIVANANVVRTAIADSTVIEVVQYSPNEIAIIGVGLGSTTLTLWFENDPHPLIYLVTTIEDPGLEQQREVDYGKLERKLQVLFPDSQVYLMPLSYKIVVKGQARDAEEAARILEIVRGEVIDEYGGLFGPQGSGANGGGNGIGDNLFFGNNAVDDFGSSFIVNMLEVPGERQVSIRVRIAELNRQQLRRMGIDISVLFNNGRHLVDAAIGGLPSTITGIFENGEVNVLVNWLATNGTVKLLSEPTLTVLSGHPASFLSGGEFAVPTIVGVDGAAAQQTTFRGFGTSIIVTPTVIDKDLIRMRVVPEYSEINANQSVGGVPGLDSRRVQTTVELREGQTLALAGLIGRRSDTEVTRIPFLGELPIIGSTIFSAKRATEDETELLVLVTPELVRPMEPDEVAPVPGWYVTHPTDEQLYKHAMTEGAPDLGVYQMGPIGRDATYPREVGYHVFEPAPGSALYSPSTPYPGGNVAPLPAPGASAGNLPAPIYSDSYESMPRHNMQPNPQPMRRAMPQSAPAPREHYMPREQSTPPAPTLQTPPRSAPPVRRAPSITPPPAPNTAPGLPALPSMTRSQFQRRGTQQGQVLPAGATRQTPTIQPAGLRRSEQQSSAPKHAGW